ncbi:MAG TPA: presqualene diphosphate synthase HpnD [Thiobacillaceae bacterium]|nr:presqualene diphosphate synthase HpnD [Thiobacillaceae bacterium]HNU63153.1 presqualene diphosphate synthase HpnD [Thiobacillaceae bacterium]
MASDPHAYCQERAAASGSSFYYAFRFLPPEQRRAITAFYAFCREVDDIADECRDTQVARIKLDWWRGEILALYAGRPGHPVTQALAGAITAYRLPQEAFEAIIDGMEMDLGPVRYPDFKQLNLYCHRVAGVVGEVSALIFGHSETTPLARATLKYAHRLGLAFQLTNIIRDVGEDARRGRIYLPQDELARFGVMESDLLQARYGTPFDRLMTFQCQRAQTTYDEALALLPATDRKAQRPGLAMAAIYRTLLREIQADGCRVLDRRYALTPLRKLWLAWKSWVFA